MRPEKYYFFLIFILIFPACANISAPSGGEGDTTPPKVKSTNILDATTNFSGDRIILEFDKYMNRSSVIEALSISPSAKYSVKWNAKKIIINFIEPLLDNMTYTLQLSGIYKDYYSNSAAEPFYITFSTGGVIDSGFISGRVISKISENISLFTYKLSRDSIMPNINYYQTEPDYKITIGGNKKFTIPALKDGTYRTIAVLDKDKNGLISPHDSIGIPCFDAVVSNGKSDSIFILLINLLPNSPDSIISSATEVDTELNIQDTIKNINLSTALDTSNINSLNTKKLESASPKMKISGSVKSNFIDFSSASTNKYYILISNSKNEYLSLITDTNTYEFVGVSSGTYSILLFLDKNNNQQFDKGRLEPWEYCEQFYFIEQEIIVKDNWDVSNFIINLNKY